jgi:sugar lactone lactonase YvrE
MNPKPSERMQALPTTLAVVVLALLVMPLVLALPAPASAAYDLVDEWGSIGSGDGQFRDPSDIATDAAGNVYVTDTHTVGETGASTVNNRIQKFTSSGTFLAKWGGIGTGDGEFGGLFSGPSDLATDASDNVYVVDPGNHRVQKFDSDGTFLTKWGSEGTGDGEFRDPSGIATDGLDNLYVADRGNRRVQKFDSDGTFLTKWGGPGTGDGRFAYPGPSDLAADASGNVYVADTGNQRIQKFDSDGTFLTEWGGPELPDPSDVATDAAGNVYVSVFFAGETRIRKFDSDGTFLTEWGSSFCSDEAVGNVGDTDADGNLYATGFDEIQKFAEVPFATAIISGPCGTTTDNTPTFTFSADIAGPSVECKLDSQAFAPCSSPLTAPPLTDGEHAFNVRAKDDAYTDPTPASAAFSVDATVGGSASARRTQKQNGKKVTIKATVKADEELSAKAAGKIKVGEKSFKLEPQTEAYIPAGQSKNLKLRPKSSRDETEVVKALKRGAKARAKLKVELNDGLNAETEKFSVRLKRQGEGR